MTGRGSEAGAGGAERSDREAGRRPRVAFVINSIGTGGAERALDRILRHAAGRRTEYDICVILLDREPLTRELPDFVTVICLEAQGSLVRSVVALRRAVRDWQPDLIVSLLVRSNLAAAIVGPRLGIPTILCERMHLGSHLDGRYSGARLRVLRFLPRWLYPRAQQVLAVSDGVRHDLIGGFGLAPDMVLTIPNGFDLEAIVADGARPPEIALPPRFAVAVGRLVEAKGFDDLIRAYAAADPDVALLILGEGPERARLLQQIDAAALTGRIMLAGFLRNPFAVMARAEYLVSASRNEGFPNAIGEAMALGRAVLATDCPSGPAELLGAAAAGAGVTVAPHGLIVPTGDVAALVEGMRRLGDPAERAALGRAARERIAEFAAEAVVARYWAVFDARLATRA